MEPWVTATFKWLSGNPQDIVMMCIILLQWKMLLHMMKAMFGAIDRVGQQSVLLQELTTLVKSLVYKGRVEP
jgi:hypothetical protein